MRHRRKILVLLTLSAAAILVWLLAPSNRAKHAAERTLRTLRDKGFKLELREFDLTGTPEQRARADVLINAGRACVGMLPARELDLVRPVAGNAAVVLHTKEKWSLGNSSDDFWPALASALERRGTVLDRAMDTANLG